MSPSVVSSHPAGESKRESLEGTRTAMLKATRIDYRARGASIAEFGAALVVLIPLAICLMLVAAEVTQAYLINAVLAQSAESAAREMAIQYASDSNIATSRSLQDSLVYDNIRNAGVINASEQFDQAAFSLDTDPKTVSVTVHYLSGQYGLAPFPFIDPLNIGSNFQLQGKATYRVD